MLLIRVLLNYLYNYFRCCLKKLPPPPMFVTSMDLIILLFLVSLFTNPFSLVAQPVEPEQINPTSRITIAGVVFCDVCSTNTFSRYSYFLPGVDVHIQCKLKAYAPKTIEQITFSVNRTTDKHGVYKLEIPSVEGIDCTEGRGMESICKASLIASSSPGCNLPGLKTTSDEITVKSKQDSLCIYSLNALSYKPSKINATLCSNQKEVFLNSLNASKLFLPYCPPYSFHWPPLPQLPPFPTFPFPPFPPLPSFPFPPLPPFPTLPIPFPQFPPSLPFPFPPLPPSPPTPSLSLPPTPPPAFNLGDPRTWTPYIPSLPPSPPTPSLSLPPPPPPAFNLGDPRTWTPYIPSLPPPTPPPPAFNLGDPKTWIPNIPPIFPPPPAFNLGDPRTWRPYIPPTPPNSPTPWIPHIPTLSPPPPAFNLGDPRTWIPHIPTLSPPPPAFNLGDPRTWIPYIPPSPPNNPQNQEP